MIIDSHSHWLPEEIISNAHFYSKAWGDIEAQLKLMDEAGIERAVLSYPTTDAHLKLGGPGNVARIYNDNAAKIIKRFPKRFIGAAILPVGDVKEMLQEAKRVTEDLGFKALSLASSYGGLYLDDKIFTPVYEFASSRDLPIFVHSQIVRPIGFERVSDPLLTPAIEYVFDTTICIGKLLMRGTLREFNKVNFIFAYFGGVICHLADRMDATYEMLRKIDFVKDLKGAPSRHLKNIFVDTSGDTKKTNFLAAIELLGVEHILWGSDWPAKKEVSASIAAVKALDIKETEKEDILGDNLKKILKIDG